MAGGPRGPIPWKPRPWPRRLWSTPRPGPRPQFDPSTFTPQLFWLAVTFGVLFFAMWRFALPRLSNIMEARQQRIDADLDKAVPGVVQGAFGSTGQRCTATSRAIVEDGIYNEFMETLLVQTRALTVGDGMDPTKDVAPLASKNQLDTVLEYIGIGTEEGARLTFGGHRLQGGEFDEGYYVEPTIFTDVKTDMRIAREEIFGPVLCVFRASNLQEAVSISNDVDFGLSSSVYTRDLVKAHEYINTAKTGMVHVNAPTLGGEVHLPFGGLGASGTGQREQGTEGFDCFTETISVYIDHSAGAKERSRFI